MEDYNIFMSKYITFGLFTITIFYEFKFPNMQLKKIYLELKLQKYYLYVFWAGL